MIRRPRRSPLFPYPTLFRSLAAEQRSVAFEPSAVTAGESCRDPIDRIAALAETRLDDGWARRLADAIGGPRRDRESTRLNSSHDQKSDSRFSFDKNKLDAHR